LREDIFPELGITVTEAAKQLGVSRVQLSRVLNEHSSISTVTQSRQFKK
jgi:plasmid maintenance system antidote protein VapI